PNTSPSIVWIPFRVSGSCLKRPGLPFLSDVCGTFISPVAREFSTAKEALESPILNRNAHEGRLITCGTLTMEPTRLRRGHRIYTYCRVLEARQAPRSTMVNF